MSRTQEDGLPEYLSSPDYFGLEPTARQLDNSIKLDNSTCRRLELHISTTPQLEQVDNLHGRYDASRRIPGHIREFNRREPHLSHDLVLKIWRNNKTEAILRVFCL